MRKVYLLLAIVALLIVANFLFWLGHTRTINASLSGLKKEATIYGFTITYDDLYYTNFKSWDVEGVISNLKIKSNRFAKGFILINHIAFKSNPLKEQLELRSEGDVFFTIQTLSGESNYKIGFKNGSPTLEIAFLTSLRSFNNAITGSEEVKISDVIKSIIYYDSGMYLYDIDKQAEYLSFDSVKLAIKAALQSQEETYDFMINYKGLKYNQEYATKDKSVIDQNNVNNGAQNFNFDMTVDCLVSDKQREYRAENNIKSPLKFDLYKLDLKDLSMSNDAFKLNVKGGLDKYVGVIFPTVNFDIVISDYEKMIEQYVANINYLLRANPEVAAILPYRPLEDAQVNKLKNLFGRFKINESDIQVKFTRTENSEFMLSDIPLLMFMTELQNVLGSSVENKSAKTSLHENLENRKSKVVK